MRRIALALFTLLFVLSISIAYSVQDKISIIEVPSEIGAGTRGASLGVNAIKIAALNEGSDYFKKHQSENIQTENDSLLEPVRHRYAKRIPEMVTLYNRIADKVKDKLSEKDSFAIILAGDHSTAGGTIAGIKMARPQERIGVIWIDAHADIHTPYTTPSGNIHGMPVATAIAEDNMFQKENTIDNETKFYWDKLKNIGRIAPKILPNDIVFFTVRDTEKQENYLLNKHHIKNYTVDEIRRRGVAATTKEALQRLDDCDRIYISFCVDSMDASFSHGTGTPVGNGITDVEAKNLLVELVKSPKVCCLEIAEVNPLLDEGNKMGEITFKILDSVTAEIEQRS